MSSDQMLDFGNRQQYLAMENEADIISIDQGGEWDISLFDELENLGDADELLEAFEGAGFANRGPDLDFDIDIPSWNEIDSSSTCTDGEVSVDSLSPAHTLSSAPSPLSVEALSPYALPDEALFPKSCPPPLSVCLDSSGSSEISLPPRKIAKRTSHVTRAKPGQTTKRPIQTGKRVSIQPKPLITAIPLPPAAAAPLQAKTIIIQPLQTTVLPMVRPAPVNIQPAPPLGQPILLSQPSQILQIQTPQGTSGNVVTMPTTPNKEKSRPVTASPLVSGIVRSPSSDDDFSQRQQRMIKNRESASLSRKKKKEYLLSLEARLKVALFENNALKCENGTLKKQLESLLSENTVLKATAPKKRAVCLMVVLVFLVLNVGPTSLFQGGSKLIVTPMQHGGRHLLGFSSEVENELTIGPQTGGWPSEIPDSSEDKALMVVKDPTFLRPPPPCKPLVNRTKCIELNHELRGWIHRHEVQHTKSRHMNNSNNKPARTLLKTENMESESAQIVTVQYAENTEKKNPGSELQVYYAPQDVYSDFFDELNRRPDTFYLVSFRRDHLLLPATNHNKGSRPKMSLVLPAMNINDKIIRDKDFEVMMQIDCEVSDTRILHIRSSSIPPLLRVNHSDTFYQHFPTENKSATPVGELVGSS